MGFALVVESGSHSLVAALQLLLGVASLMAEHRAQGPGASVVVAPALSSTGSVVVAHRLLLHGMWDPPGSGLEPMSPALTGGFFTTEPPGRPPSYCLNSSQGFCKLCHYCSEIQSRNLIMSEN